jgi:hypothetical protein
VVNDAVAAVVAVEVIEALNRLGEFLDTYQALLPGCRRDGQEDCEKSSVICR